MRKFLVTIILWGLLLSFPAVASAKTSLLFNPASVTKPPGELFNLELKINTDEPIIAADLNISFDPNIIQVVKITPGSFFPAPQILIDTIDKEKGTVAFSVFSLEEKLGNDSLLSLTLKTLKNNYFSSAVKMETTSIIAGKNGKKIKPAAAQAVISPQDSSTPEVSRTPEPTASANVTVFPTSEAKQPTIILADQPTPLLPEAKNTSSELLKILGLILLVGGLAALIGFKKLG